MRRHTNLKEFRRLARLEPELAILLDEAKRVKDDKTKPTFCANAVWYGYGPYEYMGLKQRLVQLVGWCRGRKDKDTAPDLHTSGAYGVAYDVVYEALPDCRGDCICTV